MTKELMQYVPERDDKVLKLQLGDQLVNNPIARRIYGTYEGMIVSRSTDHSKIGEINLYNALRDMELRNPSVSRITSEFVTCSNIAERLGSVTGRDFKTNQPVFYEDRVLQANPEARAYLAEKLGQRIKEWSIPLRVLFIGSPEVLGYDHLDTSSGRLVGVSAERGEK